MGDIRFSIGDVGITIRKREMVRLRADCPEDPAVKALVDAALKDMRDMQEAKAEKYWNR